MEDHLRHTVSLKIHSDVEGEGANLLKLFNNVYLSISEHLINNHTVNPCTFKFSNKVFFKKILSKGSFVNKNELKEGGGHINVRCYINVTMKLNLR